MPETIYTGVNLMLPTYNRSQKQLRDFVESAESTCSDKDNIFYTFMLNNKDEDSHKYLLKTLGSERACFLYEDEKLPHLAKFWNRLYRETKFNDSSLMISMVGDDMIFQSQWWDELLLDNCNNHKGIGLWFADDCKNTHDALMVNIFTTRRLVDGQLPLPFMCEAFPCDDMDVVWDHVARRLGIRFYLPEFKLFHNHATHETGLMDDTWKRLRTVFPQVVENRKNMEKYVNERVALLKLNIPELKEGKIKPDVLFCCMGRYGDVIHASLHANRLIEMGYNIVWLTIGYYESLVKRVCSGCRILLRDDDDLFTAWGDISTKQMQEEYQGYDFYINAQPGATEHHGLWVGSGKSMTGYLKEIVGNAIPVKMDDDLKRYAVVNSLPSTIINKKPFCIISPQVVSTKAVWPDGGLLEVYRRYVKDYNVAVIVKEDPDTYEVPKAAYLFGYTFIECIALIQKCDLFIGQDSGLAWAAIYSPCKKIIYHTKKRISETNMLFSKIDSSYEDIIL